MVTPLQEAIFEELEKYTSIENMRENAQAIADKVAQREGIETCSKTYVLRMIKRREDSSEKVSFKVEPPEPESEPEEAEESDISTDAEDAEDWDFEDEEEPEPDENEDLQRGGSIDEIITLKATRTLVVVPFRIASDWTGYEGFKLTEEETKELIPVVRPLLIKYVPEILGKYLPEILCAFVVLTILGPKVKGYRQFEEDRRKAAIAQEKAEKSAEEREKRRFELEEQERLRRGNEPQSKEPKKGLAKDDPENVPSWERAGRNIG